MEYTTKRFYIRRYEESDAEALFEMESDPDVVYYIGTPPLKTVEQALDVIHYVQKQYKDYGMGRLPIFDKVSDEFIGWTGIKYETEIREYPYHDLGYRLKKKHWGKGIATETGLASLEYGFNELGLDKINAGARIDNLASQRVLEKLGFDKLETFPFDGHDNFWFEIKRQNQNSHQ